MKVYRVAMVKRRESGTDLLYLLRRAAWGTTLPDYVGCRCGFSWCLASLICWKFQNHSLSPSQDQAGIVRRLTLSCKLATQAAQASDHEYRFFSLLREETRKSICSN
jgi:hypothetical protein